MQEQRTCRVCGTNFEVPSNGPKTGKTAKIYCSPTCNLEAKAARRSGRKATARAERHPLACIRCGASFTPTNNWRQKICLDCRTPSGGRRAASRICERCGEEFSARANGRGEWCDPCMERGCSVAGCAKSLRSIPYCEMHWHRLRRHGDVEAGRTNQERGKGHIDKNGYRIISRDGRRMCEHRFVMEDVLGRSLLPNESVHHKNGVRHDNRPENLELWVSESGKHRKGQRVEDLVAFVVENYPEAVEAALSKRLQLRLVI